MSSVWIYWKCPWSSAQRSHQPVKSPRIAIKAKGNNRAGRVSCPVRSKIQGWLIPARRTESPSQKVNRLECTSQKVNGREYTHRKRWMDWSTLTRLARAIFPAKSFLSIMLYRYIGVAQAHWVGYKTPEIRGGENWLYSDSELKRGEVTLPKLGVTGCILSLK